MSQSDEVFLSKVAELGFSCVYPVASMRSVAHLFKSKQSRCGIYLLQFPGRQFYIGQAVEVVRRFSQHRKIYDDIIGFSFQPISDMLLDEVEVRLIRRAEALGLTLLNTVYASHVVGDTDLDLVFPVSEQQAWLAAPAHYPAKYQGEGIKLPDAQMARFGKRYEKLTSSRYFDTVQRLVQSYVWSALPAPRITEYSFWSISCLPSTNGGAHPRLVCVSAGVMELFVLGYSRKEPGAIWGFVNLASDVLEDSFPDGTFGQRHPLVELTRGNYRDAGQYQVTAFCEDEYALNALLDDPAVTRAGAALALRVMRKRATIYGKYHCKQLADRVLQSDVGSSVFAA